MTRIVLQIPRARDLALQAAAAARVSRAQVACANRRLAPTVTPAVPACPRRREARRLRYDEQATEPLSNQIVDVTTSPSWASIVRLRLPRRPDTVTGRIRTVVVEALQGVARWAGPHVRTEGCEVSAPPITDGDPPRAIVHIVGRSWIAAACLHPAPRRVLGGDPSGGRRAVDLVAVWHRRILA